jgi:hypothetical protein
MTKNQHGGLSVSELTMGYVGAIVDEEKAIEAADAKASRRASNKKQALVSELLARGDAGQSALLGLLNHERIAVRVSAATFALRFAPADAAPVLEAIAAGPPGVSRHNAEWALKFWRGEAGG